MKRIIERILKTVYPFFKNILPYQVYAYLAVGAFNTALNILLFALFFQYILPHQGFSINDFQVASYTVSLLLAFLITVPTGFWLSKHFAFNPEGKPGKSSLQLFKYFLVVLQGLGSDYLLMKGLIVFFNVYPTVAKIISTVVVLTFNYVLQKYFTFRVKDKSIN